MEKNLNYVLQLPFHGKFPIRNVLVFDFWHSAMISDIEELRACEKAFVEEGGQGCLDIERVGAGQAYQSGVSRHVSIGSLLVDF